MAELTFGDIIVCPYYPEARMIFWGWGQDEDGDEVMITTILRKETVWEPRMYAIGTSHHWSSTRGWVRAEKWPS